MENTLSCSFADARSSSSIGLQHLDPASILHSQEWHPSISSACTDLELHLGLADQLEALLSRLESVQVVFVVVLWLDSMERFVHLGYLGERDSLISGLWLETKIMNCLFQYLYLLLALPAPGVFD